MSRNNIPSIGKFGTVLIVFRRISVILFDMLIARLEKGRSPGSKTRGPLRS
jgi:hypothetical protein